MSDPHPHTDTGHDDSTALIVVIIGLFFAALIFTLPWFYDDSWWGAKSVAYAPAPVPPPTYPPVPAKPPESPPNQPKRVVLLMGHSRTVRTLPPPTYPPVPAKPPESPPNQPRRVVLLMGQSRTVRTVPAPAPEPEPEPRMGIPVVMRGMPVDPRTTQFLACASDAPDLSRLKS
ncbi:MAG: hypothetical protein ACKVI4_16965 [Actinomycetales bacterium]|tara:strand:+ start:948 stop:1469 length:522 start_codon:yes stop_codon:yes gene_type:complete